MRVLVRWEKDKVWASKERSGVQIWKNLGYKRTKDTRVFRTYEARCLELKTLEYV